MKTLVIHPTDKSTDFLCPIYDNIPEVTVVREGVTRAELSSLIDIHERIIMMGHGCPEGLFNVGKCVTDGRGFLIGETTVPLLRNKECIFIWCNANKFVERYNLKGFYSGMFISEVGEALYCNVYRKESVEFIQEKVDESNNAFAEIVGWYISSMDNKTLWGHVSDTYGVITDENEVAKYNHERLYYREITKNKKVLTDIFKTK